MDGRYEIWRDHIRALAIECHALDAQFDRLFNAPTVCGASDRIYRAYNRLLSTKLLNLAISIRVDLAKQTGYRSTDVQSAVLLLEGKPPPGEGFSMKYICDKIIHADRICQAVEPGVQRAGCELSGRHENSVWVVGLGLQMFCEYVLLWRKHWTIKRRRRRRPANIRLQPSAAGACAPPWLKPPIGLLNES